MNIERLRVALGICISVTVLVIPDAKAVPAVGDAGRTLFEKNCGQFEGNVRFVARFRRSTASFYDSGYSLYLRDGRKIAVSFDNAERQVFLRGEERAHARVSYFRGGSRAEWHRDIPTYYSIGASNIYPGIDLRYYGGQARLEYDLIVHPGAEPARIRLRYEGMEPLIIASDGSLRFAACKERVEAVPRAYQVINGRRVSIPVAFRCIDACTYGFELGRYDRQRDLIIDPVLLYASYFGGSSYDCVNDIALDAEGAIYVTGYTFSDTNFPLVSAIFTNQAGFRDVFVSKFEPNGTYLIYSTYIGGSGNDSGRRIVVDESNAVYVAGYTEGSMPITNAFQPTLGGQKDAFLLKISASGTNLDFCTYLGGASNDLAYGLARDRSGNLYVAGATKSYDFPVVNAYKAQMATNDVEDAFLAKFAPDGSNVFYSTYLGGDAEDGIRNDFFPTPWSGSMGLGVDSGGCAFVAGLTASTNFPVTSDAFSKTNASYDPWLQQNLFVDAFLTKFSAAGTDIVYSTLLGGYEHDYAYDLAVTPEGVAYIVGRTDATNYPVTPSAFRAANGATNGSWDGFVTVLDPRIGTSLVWSTYFGGDVGNDEVWSVEVGSNGITYISGITSSTDLPVTNAYQDVLKGEVGVAGQYPESAFASQFTSDGTSLLFSSYLGGSDADYGYGLAVDPWGAMYLGGETQSTDFPTYFGYQNSPNFEAGQNQYDGFVAMMIYPLVHITSITVPTGQVEVTWRSYMNALYTLEDSETLSNLWAEVPPHTNELGHVGFMTGTNTAATVEKDFYRVRASGR